MFSEKFFDFIFGTPVINARFGLSDCQFAGLCRVCIETADHLVAPAVFFFVFVLLSAAIFTSALRRHILRCFYQLS